MRTWLATAALFSRRMAMKMSAVVALLTVSAAAAFAQPEGENRGRRGFAQTARSVAGQFF